MSNRRLVLMVIVMLGLAGLLWLDRDGQDTGAPEIIEPVRRTPQPAGTAPPAAPRSAGRRDGDTTSPEATAAARPVPAEDRKPSINPLATVSLDQLRETLERPLFETSRRAYQPPPPPPAQAASRPPPAPRAPPPDPTHFSLTGISSSADRTIALLKQKSSGRQLRVEVGEIIDGWSVEQISEREVVISKQGVQVILRLSRKPQT